MITMIIIIVITTHLPPSAENNKENVAEAHQATQTKGKNTEELSKKSSPNLLIKSSLQLFDTPYQEKGDA